MDIHELMKGYERNTEIHEKIVSDANDHKSINEIFEILLAKQERCEIISDEYLREVVDIYNSIQGLPKTHAVDASSLSREAVELGRNLQDIKIRPVEFEHVDKGTSRICAVKTQIKRGFSELPMKGGTVLANKCLSIRNGLTMTTVYSTHGSDTNEETWRYTLSLKPKKKFNVHFELPDTDSWLHDLKMKIYIPLFDGYYMHYPEGQEGVRIIFENTMLTSVDMSKMPEYINLLDYAEFYQYDEYLREKIEGHEHGDCDAEPYFCAKKYTVPIKSIIQRRIRKELASGGMIFIHKRFALSTILVEKLFNDEQKKSYDEALNYLTTVMSSFKTFKYEVSVTERDVLCDG